MIEKKRKEYLEKHLDKFGEVCENCGRGQVSTVHEIIYGHGKRQKAIDKGYMACVCEQCHYQLHGVNAKMLNKILFEKKYGSYDEAKKKI